MDPWTNAKRTAEHRAEQADDARVLAARERTERAARLQNSAQGQALLAAMSEAWTTHRRAIRRSDSGRLTLNTPDFHPSWQSSNGTGIQFELRGPASMTVRGHRAGVTLLHDLAIHDGTFDPNTAGRDYAHPAMLDALDEILIGFAEALGNGPAGLPKRSGWFGRTR